MGGKDDLFEVHGLNEFLNVPWERMDPESIGKEWSYGRGGHSFSEDTYTITTYDHDTKKFHVWQVPPPIAAMMRTHGECEVRARLKQIHMALGID